LVSMVIFNLLIQSLYLWVWLFVPPGEAKNLILISVDTLRADRLSCYGYEHNRTPHFDLWAAEGVLFEQAFSEYPLTLPAHATMLTGQLPPRHGVRENAGFPLSPDQTTLAEVLHGHQYRTAAFIGSYVLAAEFGTSQGFETFDESFWTSIDNVGASTDLQRPSREVTARFLEWLRQNQDQTFFAFVHFYDPHTPRPDGYDAEVSHVDQSLGEIDAFLRKYNLLEKTDIVLTSDHGESLGDHGEAGHGFFVYDSTLHVPLIIRPAGFHGKRGQRIGHLVSLVDLMPTMLDGLGIDIPPAVQGRSLRPLLLNKPTDDTALYAECFVPQLHFGWSPLRSIRQGRYKYIEAPRPELYDTVEDRGELRNLFSEQPAIAKEYNKKLLDFIDQYGSEGSAGMSSQPTDPETLRRLLSLGYINMGPAKPKAGTQAQVDPKDRIGFFDRYHAILNDLSKGRLSPWVFEDLRRLSVAAPEVRGIAYLQGWAYELAGNLRTARDNYQVAVNEQPENTMARGRYATALAKLQELDEAERQFKEILKRVPSDYRSRNNLAGLYRITGRSEQAVQELRKITEMRPDYLAAWQNLGRLQAEAGHWKEAETAFLRAAQIDPRNAAARLGLAHALRAQGRLEEAARQEEQARGLP
jgi:arylsulfatase A-like enzyme/Flp pilus assembly protein TadD